jgi:hypothetical protein
MSVPLARRRAVAPALLALVAAITLHSAPALAHTRSLSYSTWKLRPDGAEVRSRVSRLDFTRLGLDPGSSAPDAQRAAVLLADSLVLLADGDRCAPRTAPALQSAPEGWVLFAWRVDCAHSGRLELASTLLLDVAPSHLHFARVERDDTPARVLVLSDAQPSAELTAGVADAQRLGSAEPSRGIASHFAIGVRHILSGWDHLAFLAALLLLAATLQELALLVSAFTLAHSVTLGLAFTGWISPQEDAVEALIGYSIAVTAAENAWIAGGRRAGVPQAATALACAFAIAGSGALPRSALAGLALFTGCHFGLLARSAQPARLRVALAFVFGLVHGLGFAGILSVLTLPREELIGALFGFNLGVEAGQLLAIAVAWPGLRALRRISSRRERGEAPFVALASAAICGVGLFWFATRALR